MTGLPFAIMDKRQDHPHGPGPVEDCSWLLPEQGLAVITRTSNRAHHTATPAQRTISVPISTRPTPTVAQVIQIQRSSQRVTR